MTPPSYAALNIGATGRRIRRVWRGGRWLIVVPVVDTLLDGFDIDRLYAGVGSAFWNWLEAHRVEIYSVGIVFLLLFVVAKYTRRPMLVWTLPLSAFALYWLVPSFFYVEPGTTYARDWSDPLDIGENDALFFFCYLVWCIIAAAALALHPERLAPTAASETQIAALRRQLNSLRFEALGAFVIFLGSLLIFLTLLSLTTLFPKLPGSDAILIQYFVIAPGCFLLSTFVLRWGLRRLKVDAFTAMRRDARPPILLLRSFADDGKRIWPGGLVRRLVLRRRRLEEIAGRVISRLGPFIAIGTPGDKLPELGAFRSYFEESEWRDAVLHWVAEARLILMIGGLTAAVQWELRAIVERGHATKLIILIPPGWKTDRTSRLAFLKECFAGTPWDAAIATATGRRVLALCFHEGGRVVGIESHSRREADYFVATNTAADFCLGGPSIGTERSVDPAAASDGTIAQLSRRIMSSRRIISARPR